LIVSSDGYILTSAHVVEMIDEVSIRLADGREFAGRVVGIDPRTDIALIKIDANGLPVATIGDPQQLAIGEWVAAIGAPFGLDATVTAGIVSAKRYMPGSAGTPVIQTDVAINQGSSGGPLFNLKGEVVGINSTIYTATGGSWESRLQFRLTARCKLPTNCAAAGTSCEVSSALTSKRYRSASRARSGAQGQMARW
jgi:serine protease Do